MKKIKPSYPRRKSLLAAPFVPLDDSGFRELVAAGSAIPCQQGDTLFVAKWRDGPGIDPGAFLAALHDRGLRLESRTYDGDVNIRVVPGTIPQEKPAPPAHGRSKAAP